VAQGMTLTGVASVRPLVEFRARDLAALLDAERAHWSERLLWDYSEVAAAVAGGLDRGSLIGQVLQIGAESVAYCYYMRDTERAIVGSLFALPQHREGGYPERLLEGVLANAQSEGAFKRVECQTLFFTGSGGEETFARAGFASAPRHYMLHSLAPDSFREGRWASENYELHPLGRSDLDAAAELVYQSHIGSADAALNTTYATRRYCRHFVETLVLRSGCGQFDSEASHVARSASGLHGVVLASQLSHSNGHICQVSVDPTRQGEGLGTQLVVAALRSFARRGLTVASLSVTVSNARAYRLYERLGFRVQHAFAAYAWARPPLRVLVPTR